MELRELGLIVWERDWSYTASANSDSLCGVRNPLDLVRKSGHVSDKLGFNERGLVGGMETTFLKKLREVLEVCDEDGNSDFVECERYLDGSIE